MERKNHGLTEYGGVPPLDGIGNFAIEGARAASEQSGSAEEAFISSIRVEMYGPDNKRGATGVKCIVFEHAEETYYLGIIQFKTPKPVYDAFEAARKDGKLAVLTEKDKTPLTSEELRTIQHHVIESIPEDSLQDQARGFIENTITNAIAKEANPVEKVSYNRPKAK